MDVSSHLVERGDAQWDPAFESRKLRARPVKGHAIETRREGGHFEAIGPIDADLDLKTPGPHPHGSTLARPPGGRHVYVRRVRGMTEGGLG